MGKGTGCFSSKPADTKAEVVKPVDKVEPPKAELQETVPAPKTVPVSATTGNMAVKVYIVYYSMYGHVQKLAEAAKAGVDSVDGAEGIIYQIAETLPQEVLEKMGAPPKPDYPVINVHDLPNADGILFGFPTRFGMMSAQAKALFDATGGLWQKGELVGKPGGVFISTATQGGGQETTIFTAVTQLAHHGMIFVPPGYSFGAKMFDISEVHGGSPWGAGTYAAPDGSRQPSAVELEYATHQGKYFAEKTKLLAVR